MIGEWHVHSVYSEHEDARACVTSLRSNPDTCSAYMCAEQWYGPLYVVYVREA